MPFKLPDLKLQHFFFIIDLMKSSNFGIEGIILGYQSVLMHLINANVLDYSRSKRSWRRRWAKMKLIISPDITSKSWATAIPISNTLWTQNFLFIETIQKKMCVIVYYWGVCLQKTFVFLLRNKMIPLPSRQTFSRWLEDLVWWWIW